MKETIRSIASQSLNGEVMRDNKHRTTLKSPKNIWWFIIDFSGQISFFFPNSNYISVINNGCCKRSCFSLQGKNYIWSEKPHNYFYLFEEHTDLGFFPPSFKNLRHLSLPPRNQDNNSRVGKWSSLLHITYYAGYAKRFVL